MIFATVGTHHQPFSRLLDALEELPGDEELVVQYGPGAPPARAGASAAFLPFGEILEYVHGARIIVTHAGVGSILCAIRAGHMPVVVPRLERLGEHVDDHQGELVRRLEEEGRVIAVWDTRELLSALERVPPQGEEQPPVKGALHEAVRRALRGD